MNLHIPDETAMEALGANLAQAWLRQSAASGRQGLHVHLRGDLGAGKTTLVRGFLRALGHAGAVKSPTYTLIEPYQFDSGPAFHLDLYRVGDAEELEYLGLRDFQEPRAVFLIEWPERGHGVLANADLVLDIRYENHGRSVDLTASGPAGERLLGSLNAASTA